MKEKLLSNWILTSVLTALALISISSSVAADSGTIMSGDGGDGDWVINHEKVSVYPAPGGLEGSRWIWLSDLNSQGPHQLTRTFEIPGTPTVGELLIACDDYYDDLFINDNYLGENRNRDGWYTADIYDITPYLQPGINTLSLKTENDWGMGGLSYKLTFSYNEGCPVAEDDEYAAVYGKLLVVAADNGVLQNDDGVDEGDLKAELLNRPSRGSLTLNDDGSFSYRPASGFLGADTFTYRVFDGLCYSDPVTVTIQVAKCPWFIKNELYTAVCGDEKFVPASRGILSNDRGAIAVVNPETIKIDSKYGTIDVDEDGSFVYYAADNINPGAYVQFRYTATNCVCEGQNQGLAKIQVSCGC